MQIFACKTSFLLIKSVKGSKAGEPFYPFDEELGCGPGVRPSVVDLARQSLS